MTRTPGLGAGGWGLVGLSPLAARGEGWAGESGVCRGGQQGGCQPGGDTPPLLNFTSVLNRLTSSQPLNSCSHTHVHTHQHTYTHTQTHVGTHAHVHTCTHRHEHTHEHAHSHTGTHAHICTSMHTRTHMCIRVCAHAYPCGPSPRKAWAVPPSQVTREPPLPSSWHRVPPAASEPRRPEEGREHTMPTSAGPSDLSSPLRTRTATSRPEAVRTKGAALS